ncbi:MAG: glycosyltransferase, partial [Candidatus Sumerlaeia bacterium]|nr:glycosyltransferase [Candidatus Sumerlaeia bacterium]
VDNPHTLRWLNFLAQQPNLEVFVLSDPPVCAKIDGAKLIQPQMDFMTKILAFKVFPKPFGNNVFKFIPYRQVLHWLQPDIIHGIEIMGYGLATVWSGLKVPKILTPWGNDIFDWPRRSRLARWIVRTALNHADIITTNMVNLAEFLAQEFNVNPAKVRCFSWGVDTEIFHTGYLTEVQQLREKLQIPPEAMIVISVRQMQSYWGIEHIVRSAEVVKQQASRPVYFIFLRGTGTAEYEQQMKTLAKELGIVEHTRFISEYLSPREMAILLNLADVFVSVPKTDLLSISVLEGMACGCVPILADLPAYRPRIQDGVNGFLLSEVSPTAIAEKILYVLQHPEVKQRFAEKNIELINIHDNWHKNASLMLELYTEAVEKYKR